MTNIARAIESWRSQGLHLLPAHSPAIIRSSFAKLHLPVSEELEFLYRQCGGMQTGDIDAHWFELWPLEKAISEALLQPMPPYVAFAQGFIGAHHYWLQMGDPYRTPVFVDGRHPDDPLNLVAESLQQALGFLLTEPRRMRLP